MNCGSGDAAFRPKARQILEIADCDIPSAAAIEVDQLGRVACSSSV